MTDYPVSKQGKNRSSWKQAQIHKKGREILAVFIVGILGLILLSGFLKAITLKKEINRSVWDATSSMAIAVNSQPPSLVIYQEEPSKIIFLSIPKDLSYATGNADEPVRGIVTSFDATSGNETIGILTNLFGINVNKYFSFKEKPEISRGNYESFFKDFASIKTPLNLFFGKVDEVGFTNLTQAELFNLWWQVKGLSLKQVDYVSLDSFEDEIVGPKSSIFKGIDREKVNLELSKYFRDNKEKKIRVQIKNASGAAGAGRLAAEIVEAYGWTVTGIEQAGLEPLTRVLADKKEEETNDLAKLFACDIVLTQSEQNEGQTLIVLGQDFAKRYF